MTPRWPQDGLERPQDGPKMAPRWPQDGPKMAPDGPKMAPRWPQDGLPEPPKSRSHFDAMHILLTCFLSANMPWHGRKIAPISSSVSPRWSQVNHKVPQDRLQDNTQGRLPHTCIPSSVARCLKMAPSASKMAPRGAQDMPKMGTKPPQDGPKSAPSCTFKRSCVKRVSTSPGRPSGTPLGPPQDRPGTAPDPA